MTLTFRVTLAYITGPILSNLPLSDDLFLARVDFLEIVLQKPFVLVNLQHIIPLSFSRKVWLINAYTNGLTVELNSTRV